MEIMNMQSEITKEPLMCKEIDKNLRFKQLPTQMLVKDFIYGENNCKYEIYLREFINESNFFMALSGGEKYDPPKKESNKEPDAISSNYELDFKIMNSTSVMEAKSIYSNSIIKFTDGVYGFGSPKHQGQKVCTRLFQALRYKKMSDLEQIDLNPENLADKDIRRFLKVLRTEKSILLFIPFEFSYACDYPEQKCLSGIKNALDFDLKASIEYRNKYAKGYDTFAAAIYDKKMLFFKLSTNKGVEYVDCVCTKKSPTFENLYDYTLN